ncbi:MAG: hypothetical protein ABIG93_02940 [archaeon]|nr:hypothetical protein [Nanoarchaeota archaeon]
MSTRGIYGFRQDDVDRLAYAQSDAGPDDLGRRILSYISQNSLEDLAQGSRNFNPANEQDVDKSLVDGSGNIEFVNLEDYLSEQCCEMIYIINLDSNNLEIHSNSPHLNFDPKGRYIISKDSPRYLGAILVHEIPLDLVSSDSIDYHIKAIETAEKGLYKTSLHIEQDKKIKALEKELNKSFYSRLINFLFGTRS